MLLSLAVSFDTRLSQSINEYCLTLGYWRVGCKQEIIGQISMKGSTGNLGKMDL